MYPVDCSLQNKEDLQIDKKIYVKNNLEIFMFRPVQVYIWLSKF